MKEYVVGLLFSPDLSRIVLLCKRFPNFPYDCWNGPGGKVEPGESPIDAMRREFLEEAGMFIHDWHALEVQNLANGGKLHYFTAIGDVDAARMQEDEYITAFPLNTLPCLKLANELAMYISRAWSLA